MSENEQFVKINECISYCCFLVRKSTLRFNLSAENMTSVSLHGTYFLTPSNLSNNWGTALKGFVKEWVTRAGWTEFTVAPELRIRGFKVMNQTITTLYSTQPKISKNKIISNFGVVNQTLVHYTFRTQSLCSMDWFLEFANKELTALLYCKQGSLTQSLRKTDVALTWTLNIFPHYCSIGQMTRRPVNRGQFHAYKFPADVANVQHIEYWAARWYVVYGGTVIPPSPEALYDWEILHTYGHMSDPWTKTPSRVLMYIHIHITQFNVWHQQ
jgi:hypothetical protein